jgi:hypothetical protein
MSNFNQITIVSVDGSGDGTNAVEAIRRTLLTLPGSKGLLIAAERPPHLLPNLEFVRVERFDYYQYSMFMIHCLHYHINMEFALIVQQDGWALNGSNWRDDWFRFDYIGAPIHAAGLDGKLYVGYSWVGQPRAIPVLNGGFCLRSRRLLEAPTKYGICYSMPREPLLRNEDIQLCLTLRDALERRGLCFAPLEHARFFSVEYMHPYLHGDLQLSKVFGHHAQTRRLRSNSVVEVNMTREQIASQYREQELLRLFSAYGYTVKCRER